MRRLAEHTPPAGLSRRGDGQFATVPEPAPATGDLEPLERWSFAEGWR